MEGANIRSRSAVLRYIAAILFGLVLGGCGFVLISHPVIKQYLQRILLSLAAFMLFLIGLLLVFRIYLRSKTSSWSIGRARNLISLAAMFVLAPEQRESTKERLVAEITEGAGLLMSVLAVAQAMASLLVLLGTFVAVATLATSYMQVERLDAQNSLIKDQNSYFREQIQELRRQVKIQDEQGDLVRRKDLLETIYDGKNRGTSMRTRVEALKALVRLDNKLIDQGTIPGPLVNLRGVDFSCEKGSPDCADFSESWLVQTDFRKSNFSGANFMGADLRDSRLAFSDLSNSVLLFAQLEGARFRDSTPDIIWRDLDRGEWTPGIVSGFTEEMFRELLRARILVEGMPATNRLIRHEFALERFAASEDLANFLNTLTGAADLSGAHFSWFWISGGFEGMRLELGLRGYGGVDLYTRIPFGVAVSQGNDEVDIYDTLGEMQLRADDLFGPYRVNIDMTRHPRGENRDKFICTNANGRNSFQGALGEYEKMPPNKRESFIVGLCPMELGGRRGVLNSP